jgi:integral membrane protein (TIGR01906 family)
MKILFRISAWLVALLVPVALTFLGLRLLLTHAFPQIEYRLPGFPADTYGFTRADRLHYAPLAIDYLLNNADISFLRDLTFPDGSPLYNERELSHMQDVKRLIQSVLVIGYVAWGLLLALSLGAGFGGGWPEMKRGLRVGGWLTVALVAGIGAFGVFSFWNFFTVFHTLFFKGGSWLFYYSDTLIRLFPMPFWEDAFLFAGLLDLLGGLALGLGLRPKAKEGVSTKVV